MAGKLTAQLTKLLRRGGGTAAPGLLAEKIDPHILTELTAQFPLGSILLSGTNGKTTSTRLLAHILSNSGIKTIHNRSGSNLTRGLISVLLDKSNLSGSVDAQLGLFEIDEAALTKAAQLIKPKVLVITNLFRDQLDRYFELDQVIVRWRKVLQNLPATTTICLNADDPKLAYLGKYTKGRVIYFGIAQSKHQLSVLPQSADVSSCPNCGQKLTYDEIYLSHQGNYFCTHCHFKRPDLDVSASNIELRGLESVSFDLHTPQGNISVQLGVPGFYNVYNGLAAAAGALTLNQTSSHIQAGLSQFKSVFGRIEKIPVGKKTVLMTLVKNPTGFNEVLRLLSGTENEHLMLALNDLLADGRDVSWIWDVEMEQLSSQKAPVTVTGIRAWDLANRLKYAGVPTKLLYVEPDLEKALKLALKKTPSGKTLYVLPTYTSMLGIRQILTKMGHVKHFWED